MCRAFICLASTNAPIKISQTNLKHKLATAKPSRKRPRSTTNNVRFSSEEPQQIVASSSNGSFSDDDNLWYDNESMERMRVDAMSTVAMAMMGRHDDTQETLRGLEELFVSQPKFQLRTGQAQKKERRHQRIESYVNAVLDEQVEQWANDTKDPTKLAEVATNLSKPQRESAVMIALNDQDEVLYLE